MANNTIPVQERWLPVPGYEGRYEVSDLGRIKSVARVIERADGKPNPIPEKILKPITKGKRYPMANLYDAAGMKTHLWHRIVTLAFLGPCPEGCQVAHNDGNPFNNKLSNLRYATVLENNHDKFRHGTVFRGEQIGTSKLDPEKVREIRRLYFQEAYSQQAIADKFGVDQTAISSVVTRRTWRHVS
jgi:hypothetical protein